MSHHHHHHPHPSPAPSAGSQTLSRVFVFSIVINLLFVGVEALVGLMEGSLSLLSDAGHNLSDVFSLVLVLVAFKLSALHANSRYTYGYRKSTVLISLLNAIILLVAVGAIVLESLHKFSNPVPLNGAAISWTAGVGIVVNGLTALLLMRGSQSDLNVRGAFLHMAADTLVSVGVVVSGIVISLTGWTLIDPLVSLAIAAVILVSTWGLLTGSLRLSLDGMPEGLSLEQVEQTIRDTPHVAGVHHIHVWAISTTDNALTAHVVVDRPEHTDKVKASVKRSVAALGIGHATLETELSGQSCPDCQCP